MDQKETIQKRFAKGFKIKYNVMKESPETLATIAANNERREFQIRPIMLPNNSIETFLRRVPASGKVIGTKRKLKTVSINADSFSM